MLVKSANWKEMYLSKSDDLHFSNVLFFHCDITSVSNLDLLRCQNNVTVTTLHIYIYIYGFLCVKGYMCLYTYRNTE